MTGLAVFGGFVLTVICLSLSLGALLNLGGVGDRIGYRYRKANHIQLFLPFVIIIAFWSLLVYLK